MESIKRRDVLKRAGAMVAGGAAAGTCPRMLRPPSLHRSPSPRRLSRSPAAASNFRSGGSIASGATTRRMRARWDRIRQSANLNQMIWSVAKQIANLSRAFEVMPGDIIYSGTPEHVGPVVRGDVMDAHISTGYPTFASKWSSKVPAYSVPPNQG
jgi:hypothetical protein